MLFRSKPDRARGHSLSGDDRERDLSGHGNKSADRGALTPWREQREGLVRIQKKSDRARGTHSLETVERDLSGHGKKSTDKGVLTL